MAQTANGGRFRLRRRLAPATVQWSRDSHISRAGLSSLGGCAKCKWRAPVFLLLPSPCLYPTPHGLLFKARICCRDFFP